MSEWMDSLDDDGWDRKVIVIDRRVEFASTARMPLSRSLGEGLFELRFTLPTYGRFNAIGCAGSSATWDSLLESHLWELLSAT